MPLAQRQYPTGSSVRNPGTVALLLVQIVLGYEWLVSGLTKLLDGGFPHGLAAELKDMSASAPAWYRHFLASVVLPHAQLFGDAIEVAEVVAGAVLIVTALLLLTGRASLSSRALGWSAVVASIAALVMVADFELANGGGFGLSLGKDTFDEGVDLDTLLTGLQLALLVFWVATLRRRPSQEPISNSRRTSLRLVLRSVFSLRHPTTSAHATSYVPAGNCFDLVPGTTTARDGT
jgi:thiosulfate dehydrogenase [quinone] large subunit